MKIFITIALILLSAGMVRSQVDTSPRVNGQLMVQLKADESTANLTALLNAFSGSGLRIHEQLSATMYIWLLDFDESRAPAGELLAKIRQHPAVSLAQFNHYVEQREIIPNDPSFTNQWALKNTGQLGGTPGADIKATYAWDITGGGLTANGDTLVVAIVDGGVDLGHSDLKLWKNRLEIPYNGIDDDGNGYTDDYNGWNAYTNSGNMVQSDHGTHVTGIAAAKGNNNAGVTGVAFNTYAMPVAGSGNVESTVVIAYTYVFDMRKRYNETNGAAGAYVVATNSSFGIDAGNPANYPLWGAMYDSLGSVGILNVASTANRGWDVDVNGDIPTSMTNESIVAVTNTTNTDTRNNQAAWGQQSIDLGAPGTSIYSTRQGDTYGYKTGTSMSSPFVTGTIGLMYAAAPPATLAEYASNPSLVASKFKRYLLASVDTIPALEGQTVSGGRLNTYNAVHMAQNPPYLTAAPSEVNLNLQQNTTTDVNLLLTSYNTGQNPYTLSFPDTVNWVYAEVPGGLLLGENPGSVLLHINASGLSIGHHTTTMMVHDYFLNELPVNIDVRVDEEVGTRLMTWQNESISSGPNPFSNSTVFHVTLSRPSEVTLNAYEIKGNQVDQIFSGLCPAGTTAIRWNPDLAPGVYLVQLLSEQTTAVLKVVKQ